MFGSRLITWMENHIVRPRKKEVHKEKCKGNERGDVVLESSESLAQSDTGISSGSQQVLFSSMTDSREAQSTTTIDSEKSGHRLTAISLPSPESAYSTGYSTDGASSGGAGPSECYINIRTGKHYFPSPAPTPTSPNYDLTFLNLNPVATVRPPDRRKAIEIHPPRQSSLPSQNLSFSLPQNQCYLKSPCKKSAKSQLTSLKLFLKSPKQEKPKYEVEKTPVLDLKKTSVVQGKPKKWFQKFGHKKTDSDDRMDRQEVKKEIHLEKSFCLYLNQENTSSPRQRNRIKTNPWLPTEPFPKATLKREFSPCLAWNRSCSNTPLQNRKTETPRVKKINFKQDEVMIRHATELSDHSEEDVTLNEMMGTYNESYVYEKETDILSDSDPTDCDDYPTDSEADNGGDERDSHDDELDYIDNGSFTSENFIRNTGQCTYHELKRSSFLGKTKKDRKNSKRESRREKRRPSRKIVKKEEIKRNDLVKLQTCKSAGGTPLTARRETLRETHIGSHLLGDAESDRKYNQLMKEAENMLETMWSSGLKSKMDANLPKKADTRKPLGLNLTGDTPKKLKRLDLDRKNSFKARTSAHSPLDPLGPTLRQFSIFRPVAIEPERKTSTSSEECERKNPVVFQSVDLGKPLNSYCPQSEPVKRKIYSCSKTYDKIVKQLENKSIIFEESDGTVRRGLDACLKGNQGCQLKYSPVLPPDRCHLR